MNSTRAYRPVPATARRNSRTLALETIREKIITLEILPGTRLSENELAEQLGLSRTPIRESLILLAEEQLVYVVPQVGTVVAPILLAEIETAQFVRESLELAALTESLARVTAQDLTHLNAIVDAQRIADSRKSLSGFFTLDEEFHAALMAVSGHGSAWRTVAQAKAHLDRARHLSLSFTGMAPLIDEHQLIVDGLAAGDSDAAVGALRSHLRRVFDDVAAVRQTSPELFTV